MVEVARISRALDLGRKMRLYARAGVPEYWVVDLVRRGIHAHRSPGPDGYDEVMFIARGSVTSRVLPAVTVDLVELLGRWGRRTAAPR